jgi:serine phosphatase RsbU (regulator of sigma subunit)
MPNFQLKSWIIFAALLIASIIGNIYSIPFFFGVDFLFGSIATMIILQHYGLFLGTVSAIVASLYTYLLWGHPYAIIFLTCEALWLGWILKRTHGYNLVLYDLLYWLFLGIPLIWLFFILIMHMNSQITWLIALKWTINGAFNALCATLILAYTPLGRISTTPDSQQTISFQRTIYNVLATAILSVALGIMVFNIHLGVRQLNEEIIHRLESKSFEIKCLLNVWLEQNLFQRESGTTKVFDPNQLKALLKEQSDEEGLKMTLLDQQDKILATTENSESISQVFNRHQLGESTFIDADIFLWTPEQFKKKSMIARWKNSFYVHHSQMSNALGWKIIVERSLAPYQRQLYDLYIKNLTIMLIIILFIIWLSGKISKQMVVSLEKLSKITAKLSAQFSDAHQIAWPKSQISEVNLLVNNFQKMSQTIEERTLELAQANQEITALNERLKEENIRLSAELDIARRLQQMVLPTNEELKDIEGLDIAGFMEPADEVGGDYYDVLQHGGYVKIGIGDVTGHGLESGVVMLMVQMAVQTLLTHEVIESEQFLTLLNHAIHKNIQRIQTDKNLTLSLLDYKDGKLRITGQHEEVLVVRQSGEIERLNTIDLGFMVGVVSNIANFVSHSDIHLEKGDGIILYTDGITEARNCDMALYGIERLCEVVSQHWHLSAQEIQLGVIADVRQFIGKQKLFDDITLLVLKQK